MNERCKGIDMKKVKYLIIGAGISGLTFAAQKKSDDYLIIERDQRAGGLCKSFSKSGFVWDVAGHFFHFHSNSTKNYYDDLVCDYIQRTVNKCAKVYYNGYYMDAPFQYHIDQLPKDQFLECLTDLFFAEKKCDQNSFEAFVTDTYGEGIARKFLIPYNEKLYACSMNSLDKDAMSAFLPKLDFDMLMQFYRGKRGITYNDTFQYPIQGCEIIISSLLRELENERIKTDEPVIGIDLDKQMIITHSNKYYYDYLINTIPLSSFLKLANNAIPEFINYNKVLVINIGFDLPSIKNDYTWAYYPGDEIFYRVGFYNNIAGTERLSVYVEIAYSKTQVIDVQNAFKRVLKDLKHVGIINDHAVVDWNYIVIDPGYVHINEKSKLYTNQLFATLERKNVHMIGRYARWEYSAMDDSIEQAFALSNKI